MEKEREFVVFVTTCCKNPCFDWVAPSLVEVEDCGLLPLGEVELVVGLYPSSVRWIGCCLATGLPLSCEAVFERGVRYS